MRIHITGNAGAGKTTLAQQMSEKLAFDCYHLDQIVWNPHWRKSTENERTKGICEITSGNSWIIEGVSKAVREKSDLVIFLDVPRYRCLWRCFKRNLFYLFRSRPELPAHCPEILIVPKLLGIIWNFPAYTGEEIRQEAEVSGRYLIIRNAEELDDVFDGSVVERAT